MKGTVKLKENKIFVQLFKRGGFICDKTCVVYFKRNNLGYNRLGISTGKKTGNAVVRSRCRRIIRQAYTENEGLFPTGYDFVFVSRVYTGCCKSTDISNFIRKRLINDIKNGKSSRKSGNSKDNRAKGKNNGGKNSETQVSKENVNKKSTNSMQIENK